ncbi:hypothetical protein ENHYD8BJ_50178 [Enhydrobacter sp. 8BJ]|nr:hypothetical protein ENHYD8BJ_50178 [Enhydrobacter sp. 8BJ]
MYPKYISQKSLNKFLALSAIWLRLIYYHASC